MIFPVHSPSRAIPSISQIPICSFSLGEEIYPMNSKITLAQLSSGVRYPGAKSKALSRIIIFGALIAAFVNVREAQAR
jgi:hypothetical protein